jgi:acyl-CoA thioesterase YciA
MEYRTRKMVMDKDLNPAGTLFGGRALEWIDEEAAIFAYCQLKYPSHLVTKAMSAIDFKAPARRGDIVEIGTETVKVGTTSITIAITLRNKRTQQEIVRVDGIVFVNLGLDGKPQPHNVYISEPGEITTGPATKPIISKRPINADLVKKVDELRERAIARGGLKPSCPDIHYGMGKAEFEDDKW